MITSVNLQDVKDKLYLDLKDTGWDDKLKSFLQGTEMDKILETLLKEAMDGKRFTPPVKYIFRALKSCHFNKTRVVIIGQDPYPQIDVADGLAFSCSRQDRTEVSLQYMQKCIMDTVPQEDRAPVQSNDLSRWADQGVLLLNTAFTTSIGKPGTHQILWRNMMVNILDALVWNTDPLVYVFLGKKAQEFSDLIPDVNYKIITSHPASASYSGTEWDCGDLFNKVNSYLLKQSKSKIIW